MQLHTHEHTTRHLSGAQAIKQLVNGPKLNRQLFKKGNSTDFTSVEYSWGMNTAQPETAV